MADIAKVEAGRQANAQESGKIAGEHEEAPEHMSNREDLEAFLSNILDSDSIGVPEKKRRTLSKKRADAGQRELRTTRAR